MNTFFKNTTMWFPYENYRLLSSFQVGELEQSVAD